MSTDATRKQAAKTRRNAILELSKEGPLPMQCVLAKQFKVADYTITLDVKVLRQAGYALEFAPQAKPKNIVLSEEKIESIKADYVGGFTLNQLATKYRLGLRRLSDMTQPWVRADGVEEDRISRASVRTKSKLFVSATYSDKKDRAEAFQIAHRKSASKFKARFNARAAA